MTDSIVSGLLSVSVAVTDQDRALTYYRDVLGCSVRRDAEVWPGARYLEVVPPGSDVGIALLTRSSGIPIGPRFAVRDAGAAHGALTAAGAPPAEEVLRTDFAPPMFEFTDPDGNALVVIEVPLPDPAGGIL